MITQISLHGHDSELFSFLDEQYIQQLQQHPAAIKPLWTFGTARSMEIDGTEVETLSSVPMWNASPNCFAWTSAPDVAPRPDSKFRSYKGFVTDDPLIEVSALALVRQLFGSGYTCALDDHTWIQFPADRQLERLAYIRGWHGMDKATAQWSILKAQYFDWCLDALEVVEQALAPVAGVVR